MYGMKPIIGHERQLKYLERVIARGRLAHAYLFHGPEHIGKETIARAIAKFLLCPNTRAQKRALADADDGCTVCASIDAGTHQDITSLGIGRGLMPAKETRKEIPIGDIRELKRRFAYAARGVGWRIAILSDADKMSSDAADAFLKLLEEPGERTIFFLITSARERIAPTIASRALPLGFGLVPDEALGAYLKGRVALREVEGVLALAAGRAGIACLLALNQAERKRAEKARELFASAVKAGATGALAYAEDADMRQDAVYEAVALLRARLHGAADAAGRSAEAGRIRNVLDISAALETTNVAPRLALDILLMNLY